MSSKQKLFIWLSVFALFFPIFNAQTITTDDTVTSLGATIVYAYASPNKTSSETHYHASNNAVESVNYTQQPPAEENQEAIFSQNETAAKRSLIALMLGAIIIFLIAVFGFMNQYMQLMRSVRLRSLSHQFKSLYLLPVSGFRAPPAY